MSDNIKENISDSGIWMRLIFMLLFTALFCIVRLLLGAVVVIQFLWVLFSGGKNDKLLSFANQLATYIYQVYRYLSFNTEQRPFPFDDFPTPATLIPATADDIEIESAATSAPTTDDRTTDDQPAESDTAAETSETKAPSNDSETASEAASETGIEVDEEKKP